MSGFKAGYFLEFAAVGLFFFYLFVSSLSLPCSWIERQLQDSLMTLWLNSMYIFFGGDGWVCWSRRFAYRAREEKSKRKSRFWLTSQIFSTLRNGSQRLLFFFATLCYIISYYCSSSFYESPHSSQLFTVTSQKTERGGGGGIMCKWILETPQSVVVQCAHLASLFFKKIAWFIFCFHHFCYCSFSNILYPLKPLEMTRLKSGAPIQSRRKHLRSWNC